VGGAWLSMGAAAAAMGLFAWAGARALGLEGPYRGLAGASLRLFPLIGASALVYGALLLLLRVPEGAALLAQARRRLRK